MQGLRTGLRHRLRRALGQIEEQHRALGAIAAELDAALAVRSLVHTVEWLDRFAEALRAHFDLEDTVLFPAVHGLAEESEPDLRALTEEHAVFLETLTRIHESVAGGASADPASTLSALRERLREHEHREETLLLRVIERHGDG